MRNLCLRCLRPTGFCLCGDLPSIRSACQVVLLQHPREARLAICTARMAHLSLPGSELHRGVVFEEHPRVRELCARPDAALLFPGAGAVLAEERAAAPPGVLFVIDGTWHLAAKIVKVNPSLAALPRISLAPAEPSGYAGLRKEPEAHCLSTIEAVALALGTLERDPARYEPLRAAFRRSVARQLACAEDGRKSPRHRIRGVREPLG
ncbi:tRNA-uridine aminocarboxypropyltransferase [Anaeromyxobacter paludicola]|uniref:tRNA-uridine aminocarboxypropyltransferase n=1 Tax=Anaeromyxobacter paludicola TaxID=2918171 RepID=A0ABM7X6A6_9BACT|nr:tRNA-uridine aminocarboxypropyltransferase [Anaeromyxobacter paludicola]BDG07340.1 DTW domain-containing protein [Anaeromyxobacter paludicola]